MLFKVLHAIKILENYIAYQHDTTWLFECANAVFGYRLHTDSTSNSFNCKRSILTSNSSPCPFISAHLELHFFFVLVTIASHPSCVATFFLHCFYQGLAPRLKDVFSHNDHYTTLQQCIEIAYHIDQLYWEKQEQQEHDQKPSSSGKASSGKGSDN